MCVCVCVCVLFVGVGRQIVALQANTEQSMLKHGFNFVCASQRKVLWSCAYWYCCLCADCHMVGFMGVAWGCALLTPFWDDFRADRMSAAWRIVKAALREVLELPACTPGLAAFVPLRLRTGALLYNPSGCGALASFYAIACTVLTPPLCGSFRTTPMPGQGLARDLTTQRLWCGIAIAALSGL